MAVDSHSQPLAPVASQRPPPRRRAAPVESVDSFFIFLRSLEILPFGNEDGQPNQFKRCCALSLFLFSFFKIIFSSRGFVEPELWMVFNRSEVGLRINGAAAEGGEAKFTARQGRFGF